MANAWTHKKDADTITAGGETFTRQPDNTTSDVYVTTSAAASADALIRCLQCQNDFVFTAGEQQFYQDKALQTPKRCKACRDANKAAQAARRG